MEILKKEVLKAQENGDIAELYTLEQRGQEMLNEEDLAGYYANILDLALERLTQTLEQKVRLNIEDIQDFSTLRALYEYAMEFYSAKKYNDASALFEILGGLSNDVVFAGAMRIHQDLVDLHVNMDDFISKMADIEATQEADSFYVKFFTDEAKELLGNLEQKVTI